MRQPFILEVVCCDVWRGESENLIRVAYGKDRPSRGLEQNGEKQMICINALNVLISFGY